MVSSDIISQILAVFKGRSQQYNVGTFISNDNGTSFYLSSKRGATPVQIRLSNHGTYLKTWIDRTHLEDSKERLLDPSHCINISVVFIDEGQDITKDCPSQQDCEGCLIEPCIPQTFEGQNELGHPFSVKQYCYQSKFIRQKYINGIVKAMFEAIIKGEYVDPLASLKRAAKPKTLSSKQEITTESKTNKNMKKNVVMINESTLRQIVAESVKKVLNENYNQDIVDDAIQAIFSIREKVSKVATQVGFNPGQRNDEVSKLIKQISTLMYRLDRTVNSDYYDSFYSGQD